MFRNNRIGAVAGKGISNMLRHNLGSSIKHLLILLMACVVVSVCSAAVPLNHHQQQPYQIGVVQRRSDEYANDESGWRRSGDPKRADSGYSSALLSRYGRSSGSAVLSRYGKRSSLFAPSSSLSLLQPVQDYASRQRVTAAVTPTRTGESVAANRRGETSLVELENQYTGADEVFLCRRAFGDLLRCIPTTTGFRP